MTNEQKLEAVKTEIIIPKGVILNEATGTCCFEKTIIVSENCSVGSSIGNGWKIRKIKKLKNGNLRVEVEKCYEPGCSFKDDELLIRTYHYSPL